MSHSPKTRREALITQLAAKLPSKAAARRFATNVAEMDEKGIRREFEFQARISRRSRRER